MPLPQKRIIKAFRKAGRQGRALDLGQKVGKYIEEHQPDDAAKEMKMEQGDMANANDFDTYNTDGTTMGDVLGSKAACMVRRRRVLVEIGERRRMRALASLEAGHGRKLMEQVGGWCALWAVWRPGTGAN